MLLPKKIFCYNCNEIIESRIRILTHYVLNHFAVMKKREY